MLRSAMVRRNLAAVFITRLTILWWCLLVLVPDAVFVDAQAASCACNTSSNFAALRSLRAALGNPPSLSWASYTSVCSFQGVYCAGESVTQLYLSSISTSPTIPTTWNLPSLTYLSTSLWSNTVVVPTETFVGLTSLSTWVFSSMTFVGSLPSTFTGLTNLQQLNFNSCRFSGSIPSAWSISATLWYLYISCGTTTATEGVGMTSSFTGLTQLRQFSVMNCKLSGSVPTTWSGLNTQLQTLQLTGNQFSGSVPSTFVGLSMLRNLYLSSNQLSGALPGTMSGVPFLSYFMLDSNPVSSLPSSWTGFSYLTTLSCQSCVIVSLPSSWSGLSSLQNLYLSHNNMLGDVSATRWFELPSLRYLSLSSNKLSGTFPAVWSASGNAISQISLDNNALTGTFPHSATGYGALTTLFLSGNRLSGGLGPASIVGFPSLQTLHLHSNRLNSTVYLSAAFRDMTALRYLYLHNNLLVGSLGPFTDATLLPNLFYLLLNDNNMNGTLPSQWLGMQNLTYLALQSNRISGSFPSTWSFSSTLLRTLLLSNNSLSGTFPSGITGLSRLTSLYLSYNAFTGALPSSWTGLAKLYTLFLDHNQFSSIPSEVGRGGDSDEPNTVTLSSSWSAMEALESLNLASNAFNGTVPWSSTILQLSGLYFLNLSDNRFTGTLPDDLSTRLPNLETVDLSTNAFGGTIPSTWSWSYMDVLYLNDNALIGALPPLAPASEISHLRLEGNRLRSRLPAAWGSRGSIYDLTLCRSAKGSDATHQREGNMFCAPVPGTWTGDRDESSALLVAVLECDRLTWACTESVSLPSLTLSASATEEVTSPTASSSETAPQGSTTVTLWLSPTAVSASHSPSLTEESISHPKWSSTITATASATATPTPTSEPISYSESDVNISASSTPAATATDGECRGWLNDTVTVLSPNHTTMVTTSPLNAAVSNRSGGISSTAFRFVSEIPGDLLAGTFNASIGPLGPWTVVRTSFTGGASVSTRSVLLPAGSGSGDGEVDAEEPLASFLHVSMDFVPQASSGAVASVWVEFGCATERRGASVSVTVLPLLVRPASTAERAADVTLAVAASASASLGAAQDANLQTLLSLVHCGQRAKPPRVLAVYLLSPFFDFGSAAMAFGNVGLVLVVALLHMSAVVALWQWRGRQGRATTKEKEECEELKAVAVTRDSREANRRRRPPRGLVRRLLSDRVLRSAAATLRFPSVSVKVLELLFQGSLYASVRLGWEESEKIGRAASVSLGVVAAASNVAFLVLLHFVVLRVVLGGNARYQAHPPWTPAWRAHMLPSSYWAPADLRGALSPLLPLQKEWTPYVVAIVFGLPLVMGVLTGMENRSRDGCLVLFSCIAACFGAAAVFMAAARPHRVPLVSVFAVVKFSLLSAICAVQAHSDPAGTTAGLNLAHSAVLYVALGHRLLVMWFERQSDRADDAAEDGDHSEAPLSSSDDGNGVDEADRKSNEGGRPLNVQDMVLLLPATDAQDRVEPAALAHTSRRAPQSPPESVSAVVVDGGEVSLFDATMSLDDDMSQLRETERVDNRDGLFSALLAPARVTSPAGSSSLASGSDLLLSFYRERSELTV